VPQQSFTQVDNGAVYNSGPHLVDLNGDGLLDIVNVSPYTRIGQKPEDGPPNVLAVALNRGVKPDPTLGFLLKVQNSPASPISSLLLEASTNLTEWLPLATNSPVVTWSLIDRNSSLPQRFYRMRRP
jgi:hypothetical protein